MSYSYYEMLGMGYINMQIKN